MKMGDGFVQTRPREVAQQADEMPEGFSTFTGNLGRLGYVPGTGVLHIAVDPPPMTLVVLVTCLTILCGNDGQHTFGQRLPPLFRQPAPQVLRHPPDVIHERNGRGEDMAVDTLEDISVSFPARGASDDEGVMNAADTQALRRHRRSDNREGFNCLFDRLHSLLCAHPVLRYGGLDRFRTDRNPSRKRHTRSPHVSVTYRF